MTLMEKYHQYIDINDILAAKILIPYGFKKAVSTQVSITVLITMKFIHICK